MAKAVDARRAVTVITRWALAGALALVPTRGNAGDEKSAPAQPRIRVSSAEVRSGRMVGTLVRLDEESLTLRLSEHEEDLRLKRHAITDIEISRRRGNRGKAIGLGVLAGAAVGGVIGAMTESDCPEPHFPGQNVLSDFGSSLCNDLHGVSTAGGVIFGMPAGALIGFALSHGERWEKASADGLHVAIAPTRRGAMLRVSFRF
jgi:hypothetical protein